MVKKITNDRFVSLENDVNILKSQINKINSKIKEIAWNLIKTSFLMGKFTMLTVL